jgi:predicted transcriptional regulator of viral defense system
MPSARVRPTVPRRGLHRARDLEGRGMHRKEIQRLVAEGRLVRIARGLYASADASPTADRTVAEVAALAPNAVVCLLSALRLHGLTTQVPHEVWIAVPVKAWRPGVGGLPVRVLRFSGDAFTEGVETRRIEGVPVRVYAPAKTVADCFKYRNKIGLDVAMEALREFRRAHRGGMDELWRCAEICRVRNVMRPYIEATA